MEKQGIRHLTFPLSNDLYWKIRTIANIKGKTIKTLFFELVNEYFEREENKKILANIR